MPLRWIDRPLVELVRISWPIALSMVSYSLMTLVDTLLVGHIGRAELAGVGLGGIAAFTFLCFSMGLLRGANTLVAQAVGAGRQDQVPALLGAALVTALGLGLVTLAAGQLLAELLRHFAATPAAGAAARTYLRIRILGAPLALLYTALREVRYGRGESRAPMAAALLANLVNVGLAYLFVFVLGRGVAGAAVATVIAHAVEAGFLALALPRGSLGAATWRSGLARLPALWRMGLPLGLQFALEVGSFALLSLLISLLSEVEMAAHQIAIQVIHFSFLPALAIAEGASVLAGQAVGANRDDMVIRIARLALLVAGTYTGLCTLALVLASAPIAGWFTADENVTAVATRVLHIAAAFQVIDAANMSARGALRGAGDVRYSATVGVLSSWVCTPPLCWLLGYKLGFGAEGGWMGLCAEILTAAALLWRRLEGRGWAGAAAATRASLHRAT